MVEPTPKSAPGSDRKAARRSPVGAVSRGLRIAARVVFVLVVLGVVVIGGGAAVTLARFGRDLPDSQQLSSYVPATGSKVYDGNGNFLAEFASERRIPMPIGKISSMVIHAFLAAEDRDFYTHNGVNPMAIFRAGLSDVLRFSKGQRPVGASTITQQVVRHFLLTNELSVSRKIKEAILAYRIERELSKDRILEIYLNEIYLGAGAYGVGAAAETYFQKPLDQLSLSEVAFLAALPKAPNNYQPLRHAQAAKARRDWVLAGMAENGWVSAADAKAALAEPLVVHMRTEPETEQYGYFAEEVRRELVGRFGEKEVYEGGLAVRTSYAPNYQAMAERAFRNGLVDYDRRHGWRGPLAHYPTPAGAQAALAGIAEPAGIGNRQLAAVVSVEPTTARIVIKKALGGRIPIEDLRWARKTLDDQRLGAPVRQVRDVLSPGDIVLVEPIVGAASVAINGKPPAATGSVYGLRQIPDASGGVVVMEPKTGRVLAMVGGWDFRQSQFNRATQAKRQPGSAIKPLVYVTALQNGFSPDSVVDDAPIEIPQGPGLPPWRPVNYEGTFAGPSTLRDALIHSRNLVTARLATMIGLPAIAKTIEKFDVMDRMPLYYSMALGAGETTLLRLTAAYAMLDNNGRWLLPSVIDTVQDRAGKIVYQKGAGGCAACFIAARPEGDAAPGGAFRVVGAALPAMSKVPNAPFIANAQVYSPTKPDPLVSANADYEIVSMMQGVVEHGTGIAVAAVGKPIAGKTGTTSDWYDAWFVGFSPDLAAGVYVGFDDPRTLGDGEVGGHVAAPIFRDFMAEALKNAPATPFPVPAGAEMVASAAGGQRGGGNDRSGDRSGDPKIGALAPPPPDDQTGSDDPNARYAQAPPDPYVPAIAPRSAPPPRRYGGPVWVIRPAAGTGGLY